MEGIMHECINVKPFEGNDIAPPLKDGKRYHLLQTFTCKCGQVHFDVGLRTGYNFVNCYKCGEELPKNNDKNIPELPVIIHWCHSSRFKLVG